MKKYYAYVFYAIVIISLGNAGGAGLAQDRDFTGSPISSGTCAGCHNGGNFSPDPVIQVMEDGVSVDKYVPGQTYQVNLTINASNFPSGFGFQMIGLDDLNAQVGSFGTPSTGTRLIKVNGRDYFEQTRRLSNNSYTIDWTAPDAGTGDITWYAVGNAVNANGNTGGDAAATTTLSLLEDVGVAVENTQLSQTISMFPIPADNYITIDLGQVNMAFNGAEIYDLQGRLQIKSNDLTINLSSLHTGSYLSLIHVGEHIAVKRFVKL